MSLATKQVKISGKWLMGLLPLDGYWGDLSWVHQRAGGFYSAQFTLLVPPGWRHPKIIRGASVELWDGGHRMGIGQLSDLDWDNGTFQVAGLCQMVMGPAAPIAFDGTLGPAGPYTTSVPNVAVDQAIARVPSALPGWSRTADLGSTALIDGDITDKVNTVGQILDAQGTRLGLPWQVDQDGAVAYVADSTAPDYHIHPGQIELGTGDDDYVTHVYVNYVDTVTSTYRRASAADDAAALRWGRVELPVDVTDQGSTDAATAQSIADFILANGRRRPSWVNSIEVSADQLRRNGGMSADLDSVRGGQMVRAHGLVDEANGLSYVDIVIAEVQRAEGAPTVTLLPQGLAARTMSSVIEQATKAAVFVPLAA